MGTFELKEFLPKSTQVEIDRISAIASAQRSTFEANFLTALSPYTTNKVLRYATSGVSVPYSSTGSTRLYNTTDLILEAEGNTVPDGYDGFKQGAIFRKLNKTGMNVYINTGTSTVAVWTPITGNAPISASPSLSSSPSASPSLSASLSPSLSASRSPSLSASPSSSASLSASRSPSVSASLSASPSASASPSSSASRSPSLSASPSASASPSSSVSSSISLSPSLSPSPSFPF